MNTDNFNKLVDETFASCKELLRVKGGEYSDTDNCLSNFERGAELTGSHPLQIAFIYMSKHYDAVATAVRDVANNVERERSEDISGRLDDLINYSLFLKALFATEAEPEHLTKIISDMCFEFLTEKTSLGSLELLHRVNREGIILGGERPRSTLDAILNADDRFARRADVWTLANT